MNFINLSSVSWSKRITWQLLCRYVTPTVISTSSDLCDFTQFRNIHFHLLPLQASKSVKLRKIDFSPVLKRIWYPGLTFLGLRIETRYFPRRIIWCQWDRHEIGCVLRKSFSPTPTQKIEYS